MSEDWRSRAACRDLPPTAAFPEKGSAAEAMFIGEYCGKPCPVRGECLAFALAVEENVGRKERFGIFGGFTGPQRLGLVRRGVRTCAACRRPFVPARSAGSRCRQCACSGVSYTPGPVREHGKRSGYEQHLRRGERPCVPCRLAKNEYDRLRRASRGAA